MQTRKGCSTKKDRPLLRKRPRKSPSPEASEETHSLVQSDSLPMARVGTPLVGELARLFRANGSAVHAAAQGKYLKNLFPVFGLYAKRRRELLKDASAEHPITTSEELFATVDQLWLEKERDFQHTGSDLLQRHHKLWPVNHSTLARFEKYITEKSWWDTVDCLASNCVGALLKKDIDSGGALKLREEMDDWVKDDNMWKRRTALIHQLRYKADTVDQGRLFAYCEQLMHEKEFFIRKAIGWCLRNHSRNGPECRTAVAAFVGKNRTKLSPLSLREATKYL